LSSVKLDALAASSDSEEELKGSTLVDSISRALACAIAFPAQEKAQEKTLNVFDSSEIPRLSVLDYLRRLRTTFRCCDSTFVGALVILDRLLTNCRNTGREPQRVTAWNVHRLFFTCLVASVKFNEDHVYTNRHYAKAGGVQPRELGGLERFLLGALDFDLCTKPEQFWSYVAALRALDATAPLAASCPTPPCERRVGDEADCHRVAEVVPPLEAQGRSEAASCEPAARQPCEHSGSCGTDQRPSCGEQPGPDGSRATGCQPPSSEQQPSGPTLGASGHGRGSWGSQQLPGGRDPALATGCQPSSAERQPSDSTCRASGHRSWGSQQLPDERGDVAHSDRMCSSCEQPLEHSSRSDHGSHIHEGPSSHVGSHVVAPCPTGPTGPRAATAAAPLPGRRMRVRQRPRRAAPARAAAERPSNYGEWVVGYPGGRF